MMQSVHLRRLQLALAFVLVLSLASAQSQQADEDQPFTIVPPEKAYFYETFQGSLKHWVRSTDDKFKEGEWAIGNGAKGTMIKGEQGLLVRGAAKHHAISALLPDVSTEKGLIVQYEVKLHNPLNCGGAYLKLLRSDPSFTQQTLSSNSPYVIMFGPDRCGTTDKVHFIFNHKNPVSGNYSEKHLKYPPNLRNDRLTHLYTLSIFTDNKFEIKIDQAVVTRGTLLDDMSPPVNPSAEIEDPDDKPPADWVFEKRIPDPTHVKPADWDESEPATIPDPTATKPAGWREDIQPMIPANFEKPFGWDEAEKGPWSPPLIDNPYCDKNVGCGPWSPPHIPNPKFKGKWMPRLIDNPAYKGEWKPRKIANPYYFKDLEPYKMDKMGAIGFELWTMQDDIEFDNIYIGYDTEDAYAFAERTWRPKYNKEKEEEEKNKPKPRTSPSSSSSGGLFSDPIQFFRDYPAAAVVVALFSAVLLLFACARLLVRKPTDDRDDHGEDEDEPHSHSHSHDHGDHSHSHSHGPAETAAVSSGAESAEKKEEEPASEESSLKQRKKGKPRKDQ